MDNDRSGPSVPSVPSARLAAHRARWTRLWTGLGLVSVGLPALTAGLVPLRGRLALESVLLLYLLAVVLVAVTGGIIPGVVAAMASVLLANFFFTTPYHTLVVDQRDSIIALIVFVVVAVTVSVTVEVAMRHRVAAARSRSETEVLSRFTAEPVKDTSVAAVLEQVRDTFAMTSVALLERRGDTEHVAAAVSTTMAGPALRGSPAFSIRAADGLRLVAEGPELFAEDRDLLTRLATAAARAWEGQQLAGEAAHARQLAEIDRLRSALLAAVGHDLRTPLSGIKAAVSSLRQRDVSWNPTEQDELLATIEESTDRLADLIANLLAMSRLQAGALSVTLRPVVLDEIVAKALIGIPGQDRADRADHADIVVEVPDDLPLVLADPGLLERVITNLVDNARRFSPAGAAIRITAQPNHHADPAADHDADDVGVRESVRLSVVDVGPGVPAADRERIFTPFQRLGDSPADGGVGLGLAIARGFTEAMHGTLVPTPTPGGGLTMTMTLPVAPGPTAPGPTAPGRVAP